MESSSTSVVAAVVVEHKKRQQRSMAEKRRIVEETLMPGASVALVARTNGVNANLVFAWLRLYHAGRLIKKRSKTIQLNAACLLPVKVSEKGHRSEIVAGSGHAGCGFVEGADLLAARTVTVARLRD